jgi:hypothetical protein
MAQETVSPCKTCPWLVHNHGAAHPSDGQPGSKQDFKWYDPKNLERLWKGISKGNGMICHSTDSTAPDYGSTDAPKPGHERVCAGMLVLVKLELDALGECPSQAQYRKLEGKRFTRAGLLWWVDKFVFKNTPFGMNMPDLVSCPEPVGVPWHDVVLNIEWREDAN